MAVVFDTFDFYKLINLDGIDKDAYSRIVCFDYGTKKLGIAVSDVERKIAFPKDVIINNWRDINILQDEVLKQCNKYQTKNIVIGLSKKNDNTFDKKCYFIIALSNKLCELDKKIQILLFDERFTTKKSLAIEKHSLGKQCNVKKKDKQKSNKYDDAKSASIILQDVLDIMNLFL